MFLGSRKRTDFWQQAAFFGKMRSIGSSDGSGRKFYGEASPGDGPRFRIQYWRRLAVLHSGEGRFPRDGKTTNRQFILTGEKPKPGEDPQ